MPREGAKLGSRREVLLQSGLKTAATGERARGRRLEC